MKYFDTTFVTLMLCMFFGINTNSAQQFIVASGPISNTASDSRSANFFDLNNDGWEDIYISNGLAAGQKDLIYINDGTGKMNASPNLDIVQAVNPSDGASFADFNNDGHTDGVISSWHGAEDLLYINQGNGDMDYHSGAGIVSGSYAETATFGDYNNDGWLDLYITNSGGDKKNYLYRNLQNGKFQVSENHMLSKETKLSRGAIWGDFNGDRILDLFVANESNTANDLFYGLGEGVFEKISSGSIVTSKRGSMTASWGDIDNDGDFDLFVGNAGYFQTQKNQLFRNTGSGFEEVTEGPVVTTSNCSYGSAFADYDNDGDLDLLVANGFCNSGLANSLYENNGDGTFIDVSNKIPENENVCSFGVAWGDVNNDGFLDLLIANCKNNNASLEPSNKLLMNQGNDNNWLVVKLSGVMTNRSAVGATINVLAEIGGKNVWQKREISAQSGYAGQNSSVAHFGLLDALEVDSLIIHWPAGGVQVLSGIEANQKMNIDES